MLKIAKVTLYRYITKGIDCGACNYVKMKSDIKSFDMFDDDVNLICSFANVTEIIEYMRNTGVRRIFSKINDYEYFDAYGYKWKLREVSA
jgi:hypothetical protein